MAGNPTNFSAAPLSFALALATSLAACSDSKGFEPKRTAWGNPDIEGVWDFRNLTPLERPPE